MPGSIEYRDGPDIDLEQLDALRASAGWRAVGRDVLAEQVRGARFVVSAWDGARMVGFARAISDGVTNGYISTVVVDAAYRGRGIGRAMIERLVADRGGIRWVLHARPEVQSFYEKSGFEPAPDMLWRQRRSP